MVVQVNVLMGEDFAPDFAPAVTEGPIFREVVRAVLAGLKARVEDSVHEALVGFAVANVVDVFRLRVGLDQLLVDVAFEEHEAGPDSCYLQDVSILVSVLYFVNDVLRRDALHWVDAADDILVGLDELEDIVGAEFDVRVDEHEVGGLGVSHHVGHDVVSSPRDEAFSAYRRERPRKALAMSRIHKADHAQKARLHDRLSVTRHPDVQMNSQHLFPLIHARLFGYCEYPAIPRC